MKPRQLAVLVVTLALAGLALPAAAQPHYYGPHSENDLRFRFGLYTPRGDSSYWQDSRRFFNDSAEDFQNGVFSIDYRHEIAPMVDVSIGGSGFSSSRNQRYHDFVDAHGNSIIHDTTFELATFNLGLVFHLGPRHAPIQPYIGGGGAAYGWRLTESGDFIDFSTPQPEVFSSHFSERGTAYGYYLVAGLDIPVSRGWAIYAEGRWQRGKADLNGDFAGVGELDLSGREIAAGFSWKF